MFFLILCLCASLWIVCLFVCFLLYFQVHGSFFCHVWYAINFIEYKYLFMYLAALGLSCSKQDLVPWSGIEPRHAALGAWNLSYWTTREIPSLNIFFISGMIVFIFISLGFSYLTWLYLAFWTCGIKFLITVLMSLSADSNIQVSSGSVSFIFFFYMMALILFSTRYFHACCSYWMPPSVGFTISGDIFVLL